MNLTPYAWKAVVWSFSRLVQTIGCNTAQNSDDLWRKPGYQTNCFYARLSTMICLSFLRINWINKPSSRENSFVLF